MAAGQPRREGASSGVEMIAAESIATHPGSSNRHSTVIRIRGKNITVPSTEIEGRTVIVTGKVLKVAEVFDEELVEGEAVSNPSTFIATLQASRLKADLFTFTQRPPETVPKFNEAFEWDNWAIASTLSFQNWWEKLPQESRKNVRRAERRGVNVRSVPFDADLVRGIQGIYNEASIRQGKKFWHFGKDFATVKMENETYLERSEFIGAFYGDALMGFIKIIYVDRIAVLIQLLANAVEICERKKMECLVYGKYVYGTKNDSSLTEFKRRNRFEQVNFPRYYIPFSIKGTAAIRLGLHRGLENLLPRRVNDVLLNCRAWFVKNVPRAVSLPGVT